MENITSQYGLQQIINKPTHTLESAHIGKSGLKCYVQNQKDPGSKNPLGARRGFGIQPPFEAPSDPWIKICHKHSDSSNINEVIRAVLNSFFFYEKILHAPKALKAQEAQKRKYANK